MILETERLFLREMTEEDYPALCLILQDEETMTAYEHAFDDDEARDWLRRQRARYKRDGFGLWAVLLKNTGEMIGQCGITMQDWEKSRVPEIGYLFQKDYWHQGYATEAARGCRRYAFDTLGLSEVYSIIRDSNFPSMNVAIRNAMQVRGRFVKHYYGIDMPHLVFSVRKKELQNSCVNIIREQMRRVFWELHNIIACCADSIWNKYYCGSPVYQHIYHMLHSLDQWFMNPSGYREPALHSPGLNNLNCPAARQLSKIELSTFLDQIQRKIEKYLSALSEQGLLEQPEGCEYSRLHLIVAQLRHLHTHMGMLMGFVVAETGRWPKVLGLTGTLTNESFQTGIYEE